MMKDARFQLLVKTASTTRRGRTIVLVVFISTTGFRDSAQSVQTVLPNAVGLE